VETLGIFCLVITDIDTVEPKRKKSIIPKRDDGQISTNETITAWIPRMSSADSLWAASADKKQVSYEHNPDASVRVAYQTPINVKFSDSTEHEFIPTTFEDALAYENFATFKTLRGLGAIKKIRNIFKQENAEEIAQNVYELIYGGADANGKRKKGSLDKAEFALQLMYNKDPKSITPPQYIAEALKWLEDSLIKREDGDFASSKEG